MDKKYIINSTVALVVISAVGMLIQVVQSFSVYKEVYFDRFFDTNGYWSDLLTLGIQPIFFLSTGIVIPILGIIGASRLYSEKKTSRPLFIFFAFQVYNILLRLLYFPIMVGSGQFKDLNFSSIVFYTQSLTTVLIIVMLLVYSNFFIERETPTLKYNESIYKMYQVKRFWTFVIDGIIVSMYSWNAAMICGQYSFLNNQTWLVSLMAFLTYYMICEAVLRQTPGKAIMGTEVVAIKNTGSFFFKVVLRSFCRLIPFEALSFLFPPFHGWHDRFSGTTVRMRDYEMGESVNVGDDNILDSDMIHFQE